MLNVNRSIIQLNHVIKRADSLRKFGVFKEVRIFAVCFS